MNAAAAGVAGAGTGSPWSACVYQQAMSVRNAVRQRILRLKQPKYLAGAIAGALYFYFFLFRHAFRGHVRDGEPGLAQAVGWLNDPAIASVVLGGAALALLVAMLATWLLPGERSALAFSEAEVAFLFPAPMTRSQLVRYKLLRSQLAILVSSVLLTVVLRRGGAFGGSAWLHAIGWWIVLSTVRMHFIGASFARDRLRGDGRLAWLRDIGVGAVVVAAAVALFWWVRTHVPPPAAGTLLPWAHQVLALPVLHWLLWPLKLVVAPMLAPDAAAFWRAVPAALAVMALHFFWVVRSDTSFEEAAIAHSQKRARVIAAKREGRWGFDALGGPKKRPAPFRLAPTGFPPVAMLWRNLLALGTTRLRAYAAIGAVLLLGEAWIARDPQLRALLKVFFVLGLGIGGWLFVVGPMFVQRSLHRTLAYMDVLKATPLPGWQLALGELLMPMLLLATAEWLLLAIAVQAVLLGGVQSVPPATAIAGALGIALLVPPLCGLLLCLPYAGLLLFPAWASAGRGGGVEVMGQRMIFFGGYLLVLVVTLLPALLVGGIAAAAMYWMAGPVGAMLAGAPVAAAVLAGELTIAVRWLGRRIERYDLSQEQA
jgi:hypothetical protein